MSEQPALPMRAWVDESGSDHARDPGTYILAAVILEIELEEDVRELVKGVRLGGEQKLHWRSESGTRRTKIASTIAAVPAKNVVVVRSTPQIHPHDAERARRKCIERLLWELTTLGVPQAVFESRGKADDARDREMLDALRRRRALPASIHIDHVRGRDEPLLWVPDAVCGAVVEDRCGDGRHLQAIGRSTVVHTITH